MSALLAWLVSWVAPAGGVLSAPGVPEPPGDPVDNARRVLVLSLREADDFGALREYVRRALDELERA